ncbi:MAG TPA: ribosome biogenesis GTP-binding protein YihA/YsxC [Candidatus Hydrogenedentes bacterium]|nr:ribosome biogenesis GTP-binding protein YihA/YsxC [Candidatus Hydrogenedentota bacterium]HPG69150.1 ribosome biogenesis GTP-binding protein YihA/YsxC [Candidatus Hydrogenedentota bacterium]
MRVTHAAFVTSALRPDQYPRDRRPECAFAGRSNVGKSTLMNALLGRKDLAKTSRTPGKTQTINFFDVNGRVYFVDLPGYGYAKVPKSMRMQWQKVMTDYLRQREFVRLVVHLIDSRHEPTDLDLDMLGLLDEAQVPTLVVATKIDKVPRTHRKGRLDTIRESLGLDEEALILPVSAVSGEGIREVWRVIDEMTA